MKFSIQSTNSIEKLKWFIYLTNEFGVPSEENIELFMENLGKNILNGNLIVNAHTTKQLNELWTEIKLDVNAKTIYYGGIDFYTKLSCTKFTSEQDIIEFIKSYKETKEYNDEIINIKEDTGEEMGRYKLDFSITPELINTDENGKEYIEVFTKSQRCDGNGRMYKDGSVVVCKGSTIGEVLDSYDYDGNSVKNMRDKNSLSMDKQVTQKDYKFNSISSAAYFVRGVGSNGWNDWSNKNNQIVKIYRRKPDINSNNNIITQVRKYDDIPLEDDFVTAYITNELVIDIYPREQKIIVNSSTIKEFIGKQFGSLEEITMQYIINTLNLELRDIDEEVKRLYNEYLHSWKRVSDNFSIEYLYE